MVAEGQEKATVPAENGKEPAAVSAAFEIAWTPEDRLNLIYGTTYTREQDLRRDLVGELVAKCEKGGRARCWRCGLTAVRFTKLSTALGIFGVAECEACQTWCVM